MGVSMSYLPLTFLLPLLGTFILALSRGHMSERGTVWVGVSSVGLAALVTAFITIQFMSGDQSAQTLTLWTWISVGNFTPTIGLALDGLSITMLGIITGVGFLIHLFAAWYMRGRGHYPVFRLHEPVCVQHGIAGAGR